MCDVFFVDLFRCDSLTLSALGSAMNDLAASYTALGRHQDAVAMGEMTLELRRRVLPDNHPDIGATCFVVKWLI
jgi:hypothetical protein